VSLFFVRKPLQGRLKRQKEQQLIESKMKDFDENFVIIRLEGAKVKS
jgi:hypothetical protein